MDFLKWYKNRIESGDLAPPENTWNNIQDQLDIDHSWNVINSELAQQSRTRRLKYLSLAASLVLLFSIGSYFLFKTKPLTDNKEFYVQELNKSEDSTAGNASAEISDNTKNQISNNINSTDSQELNVATEIYQNIKTDHLIKEKIIEKNISYDQEIKKLNHKTISFEDTVRNTLLIAKSYIPSENEINEEKGRKVFQKIYIGATGQLANTWLLNEKTYNGLESNSLTTSNASFGSNLGLYVGTNLSKYLDLQLDLNVLAKNNQDYNEYLNGKYIEEKLSFSYSQAAVSIRFYFISKKFMHGEHGLNIGGYAGYLHNVYQTLDKTKINLSDDYNKVDYGLVLSYEYLVPISKKLCFGTGVKAYYGLKNIYAGNETIPSYLNKTNNASINISFTMKYNMSK